MPRYSRTRRSSTRARRSYSRRAAPARRVVRSRRATGRSRRGGSSHVLRVVVEQHNPSIGRTAGPMNMVPAPAPRKAPL